MKVFLITFAVMAALALGWNYWATHRAPATLGVTGGVSGVYTSRGGGRGFARVPPGPTTSLTGIVRMAGGVTHSAHVDLVRVGPSGPGRVYAGEEALGDGRFTFARVAADRYWVVARGEVDVDPTRPGEGPTQQVFGLAEVVSDGEHPGHVGVPLYPGSAIEGHLTLEPATPSALRDISLLTVMLVPVDAQAKAASAIGDASSALTSSGAFAINDVPPGRYALEVSPSSWTLDSVVVADHERLDLPFQIGTGERLAASVTLTEHPNALAGTLRDAGGRALPFALVAVFAVDGTQRDAHRRVQLVRTDGRGAFLFEGLPSGDYLLAPAGGFAPPMWGTVEFFQSLTPLATRVSLSRGLRKVQDLRTAVAR